MLAGVGMECKSEGRCSQNPATDLITVVLVVLLKLQTRQMCHECLLERQGTVQTVIYSWSSAVELSKWSLAL